MPLERPEAGYVWLHVPLKEAVDVVIVGDVHTWYAHWGGVGGGRQNRGVRCLRNEGLACAWCASGQAPRARYVMPVHVGSDLRLVELGRVQYSMLSMLNDNGGLVGRRVRLVREWVAKNAPIQVRPLGKEHLSPEQVIDLEEFVGCLGRAELAMVKPPKSPVADVVQEPGPGVPRPERRVYTEPVEVAPPDQSDSHGMQELRDAMKGAGRTSSGGATPSKRLLHPEGS